MLKRVVRVSCFLLSIITLTACPLKKLPKKSVSCRVSLADPMVKADTPVDLMIEASGGFGPYTVEGVIGAFNSTTTISRSYSNDTGSEISQSDTVVVIDDLGLAEQCSVEFAVLPKEEGDSDDDMDNDPSLSLIASPSPSVALNHSITVFANAQHFSESPQYTFEFTESGVSMDQSDSEATFLVTDGATHEFEVKVTATFGDEEASETLTLSFTAQPSLSCSLVKDDASRVGETINFKVVADSGDEITVTHFDPGTDGSASLSTDGSVNVVYSSSGNKTVRARARSVNTGVECNDGSILNHSFDVENQLSCTAYTDLASYYVNEHIWAWAEVDQNSGVAPFSLASVAITNGGQGQYFLQSQDPLLARVHVSTIGFYQLELRVSDAEGSEALCTTNGFYISWY